VLLLTAALLVAAVMWVPSTTRSAALRSTVALAADEIGDDVTETVVKAEPTSDGDEQKNDAPKEPCKMAHADDDPSLFCWSVMYDSDKDLITSQFTGRAGMFACNDFLVISPEEMSIGKDDCGVERKSLQKELPITKKGMYGVDGSMTSSWLNVELFQICWDAVIESNKVWENDFTVKLDPDTVFFPGRLAYHLKEHVGKPIYTTDCRFSGGDPVGQLFGSIEVLSQQAVGTYKGAKQTCVDLPWQGWGEDYWLQHCMDAISVDGVLLADWVTDGTCPEGGYADCSDSNLIAMHPFKDAGAWWECWKKSSPEE